MSFIHGALSWSSSPDALRRHVQSMMAAVGTYPWKGDDVAEIGGDRASCVLAIQASDTKDRVVTTSLMKDGGPQIGMVTGVQLHDRTGLAGRLGIGNEEAAVIGDADLVLRAYLRWGLDCAEHLLGVGTFAVWDERSQRLLCWRDIAGVRPLYYHYVPGQRFVFSSDLMSMAAHPTVPKTLDLEYTRAILEDGPEYQHRSRTLCDGIHKLPAAHYLTIDARGLRVQQYWQPGEVPRRRYRHEAEYVEELRDLLQHAVDCRLPRADNTEGRIGAHLSGGLDSSSVAVLAGRGGQIAGQQVTGFSWAPSWDDVPKVDDDERPLAEAAAELANIPLRYTRLSTRDVVEVACRDLALQPTTTLATELATSRDASQAGISTMLSGWGGDELLVFNGRGYFADLARRGRWLTIQRELRLRNEIHGGSVYRAWRGRVVLPLLPDRALRLFWREDRPALPAALRPDFARGLAEVEPLPQHDLRERPGVRRMQVALLTNGHLQHRMESWASNGATRGITYAFPLLDQRVIEFALSIPDHLYFKHGWKRWLYRTAMEGILPDEVRWHPHKQDNAMEVQLRQVNRSARNDYYERLLGRRDNPYVDTEWVRADSDGSAKPMSSRDATAHEGSPIGSAAWLAFTRLGPP